MAKLEDPGLYLEGTHYTSWDVLYLLWKTEIQNKDQA